MSLKGKKKKSKIVPENVTAQGDGGIKLSMEFNVSETYFPIISYIIKSLMVIFGTLTAVKAFVVPCYFPFGVIDIFLVVIPVVIVGFLLKLIPKKFEWIRVIAGVVLAAVYIYSLDLSTVVNGFSEVIGRIVNQNFTVYINSDWVVGASGYLDMVAAIKVITLFVAVMLYASTVKNPNIGMQILATLPLYAFSYIIGMKPGFVVFEMMGFYLACYALMKSDMQAKYKNRSNIDIYEKKSTGNISAQIIGIVLGIFIVVCIAYMIVRPASQYEKVDIVKAVYDEAAEVVEEVIRFVEENVENLEEKLEDIETPDKNAITGFAQGELGEFDSVELSNEVQLVLRDVDRVIQGSIYLRGFVASDYYSGEDTSSGRSYWENRGLANIKTLGTFYGDDIYEKLARYPYEALKNAKEEYDDIATGNMYIEKINKAEETYFEPSYFYTAMGVDYNLSLDEGDEDNWQVNVNLGLAHINPGQFTMKELSEIGSDYFASDEGSDLVTELSAYQEEVYDAYTNSIGNTDVLDTAYANIIADSDIYYDDDEQQYINDLVTEVYEEYVIMGNKPDLDTALAFVTYMLSDCEYTLSPGATENGEDFVKEFLFEKKKGYCTHFASAAAVMLQEMGIPARYVTGYMVNTSEIMDESDSEELELNDTYSISVNQSAAHAWVEVYVDDFGWVVYEPTAAAALGDRDEIADIIIDNDGDRPQDDIIDDSQNDDNNDESEDKKDQEEEKGIQIELSKEQKFCVGLVIFGIVLLVAVWILKMWQQYRYNKIAKLLESEEPEDKFKGLVILMDNLLKAIKAPVYFYETRAQNAAAFYETIFGIVNRREIKKKNPEYVEPDLTEKEYLFVIEVLSKGNFDKELPNMSDIEKALDFVLYTNEIVYNDKEIFGQFILKYIKCLYLKIK